MPISAEVRWFQVGSIPDGLRKWFCDPAPDFRNRIGGGRQRTDLYLVVKNTELGIKRRDGKNGLELKGFVDVLSWQLNFGRVSVAPQLFCKWASDDLEFAERPVVEIVKTRWLRKFDTANEPREIQLGAGDLAEDPIVKSERPDVGCNVELTSVTKGDETWWTFGAEAFAFEHPGRTVELVGQSLLRAMRALPSHSKVDLGGTRYLSYPEWIAAQR